MSTQGGRLMGKHTGPRDIPAEFASWWFAQEDWPEPLKGRHHLTCAPAIIRAHYNRWNASTERQHTGGDPNRVVQGR